MQSRVLGIGNNYTDKSRIPGTATAHKEVNNLNDLTKSK
jgi:hypothetical protein